MIASDLLEIVMQYCRKGVDMPGPETVWGGQGVHVVFPVKQKCKRMQATSDAIPSVNLMCIDELEETHTRKSIT